MENISDRCNDGGLSLFIDCGHPCVKYVDNLTVKWMVWMQQGDPVRHMCFTLYGLRICCMLYMLVSAVIVGLIPYYAMDPDTPISSAFASHGIQWVAYVALEVHIYLTKFGGLSSMFGLHNYVFSKQSRLTLLETCFLCRNRFPNGLQIWHGTLLTGLIPVQLLLLNLVIEGPPARALGFNPPEKYIMKKARRRSDDSLISAWILFRYLVLFLKFHQYHLHLVLRFEIQHCRCGLSSMFGLHNYVFSKQSRLTLLETCFLCRNRFPNGLQIWHGTLLTGLIPVQLLLLNLVIEGPPARALGFNPPEKYIMKKARRRSDDSLISAWILFRYLVLFLKFHQYHLHLVLRFEIQHCRCDVMRCLTNEFRTHVMVQQVNGCLWLYIVHCTHLATSLLNEIYGNLCSIIAHFISNYTYILKLGSEYRRTIHATVDYTVTCLKNAKMVPQVSCKLHP
ncbi:ER-type Ca2+-ATPase 1 [Artemisia annua]|uniref:ER-type Ca2+-ATPase 1 n=1 Tax=Artemisia annua TaxID=35608 RepID=A0A2U1MN82_ARTAN|nr:ER-type Ca2+-ATPase 1 [Artemisia annua]